MSVAQSRRHIVRDLGDGTHTHDRCWHLCWRCRFCDCVALQPAPVLLLKPQEAVGKTPVGQPVHGYGYYSVILITVLGYYSVILITVLGTGSGVATEYIYREQGCAEWGV